MVLIRALAHLGLGCGLPIEHAGIGPGDTVLDLGAGAGIDAFVARRLVGEEGQVYGVDMTPDMVAKARANAGKLGYGNVEFRLGEIENLPFERELDRHCHLELRLEPRARQGPCLRRGVPRAAGVFFLEAPLLGGLGRAKSLQQHSPEAGLGGTGPQGGFAEEKAVMLKRVDRTEFLLADAWGQKDDLDPRDVADAFYACVHEAGHVVAARAFGFPVAWVSVDPAFLTSDPLAIENECAGGDPVAMVLASDLISPILKRRFTTSAEEREIVRGYCLEVLAGPLAEARFNPLFDPSVGERDIAQAGYIVEQLEKDKFKRKRRRVSLAKEASSFVDDNATAILSFAGELFERKTIKGEDIDRLIREPAETIHLPMLAPRSDFY